MADVYDICKVSANLELTPCSGQRNVLISLACVIVYLYDVKCVVVVALLFYIHSKHLRSCRDGQLT